VGLGGNLGKGASIAIPATGLRGFSALRLSKIAHLGIMKSVVMTV
jgi:hypothetical protein